MEVKRFEDEEKEPVFVWDYSSRRVALTAVVFGLAIGYILACYTFGRFITPLL